jgi:predicted transposase YdaD
MCVQSVRRKGRQEGRNEGRKEGKGKYIIITNHSVVAQNRKRDRRCQLFFFFFGGRVDLI